jgi:hypothetical protein
MTKPAVLPPEGYVSWLDYAVATFDTRQLWVEGMLRDDPQPPEREDMREAAREELRQLRAAAAGASSSPASSTERVGQRLRNERRLRHAEHFGRDDDAQSHVGAVPVTFGLEFSNARRSMGSDRSTALSKSHQCKFKRMWWNFSRKNGFFHCISQPPPTSAGSEAE